MASNDGEQLDHRHDWDLRIHNRDAIPVWLWIAAIAVFGVLVGFAAG